MKGLCAILDILSNWPAGSGDSFIVVWTLTVKRREWSLSWLCNCIAVTSRLEVLLCLVRVYSSGCVIFLRTENSWTLPELPTMLYWSCSSFSKHQKDFDVLWLSLRHNLLTENMLRRIFWPWLCFAATGSWCRERLPGGLPCSSLVSLPSLLCRRLWSCVCILYQAEMDSWSEFFADSLMLGNIKEASIVKSLLKRLECSMSLHKLMTKRSMALVSCGCHLRDISWDCQSQSALIPPQLQMQGKRIFFELSS